MNLTFFFEQVIITTVRTLPEVTIVAATAIGGRSPCGRFVVGITPHDVSFAKVDPNNNPLDPLHCPYRSLEELEKYLEEFMEMYVALYD